MLFFERHANIYKLTSTRGHTIKHPGVAQLVAHLTGGQGVVSSSLATRTKKPRASVALGFFLFSVYGVKIRKNRLYYTFITPFLLLPHAPGHHGRALRPGTELIRPCAVGDSKGHSLIHFRFQRGADGPLGKDSLHPLHKLQDFLIGQF